MPFHTMARFAVRKMRSFKNVLSQTKHYVQNTWRATCESITGAKAKVHKAIGLDLTENYVRILILQAPKKEALNANKSSTPPISVRHYAEAYFNKSPEGSDNVIEPKAHIDAAYISNVIQKICADFRLKRSQKIPVALAIPDDYIATQTLNIPKQAAPELIEMQAAITAKALFTDIDEAKTIHYDFKLNENQGGPSHQTMKLWAASDAWIDQLLAISKQAQLEATFLESENHAFARAQQWLSQYDEPHFLAQLIEKHSRVFDSKNSPDVPQQEDFQIALGLALKGLEKVGGLAPLEAPLKANDYQICTEFSYSINLLPWREKQKQTFRQRYWRHTLYAAGISIASLIALNSYDRLQIAQQEHKKQSLTIATQKLSPELGLFEQYTQANNALQKLAAVMIPMQKQNHSILSLLDELGQVHPPGLSLSTLKQENKILFLRGEAESSLKISEYLWILQQSPLLAQATLAETKPPTAPVEAPTQFSIRVTLPE